MKVKIGESRTTKIFSDENNSTRRNCNSNSFRFINNFSPSNKKCSHIARPVYLTHFPQLIFLSCDDDVNVLVLEMKIPCRLFIITATNNVDKFFSSDFLIIFNTNFTKILSGEVVFCCFVTSFRLFSRQLCPFGRQISLMSNFSSTNCSVRRKHEKTFTT